MIQVKNVSLSFGSKLVLSEISFEISDGEIVGLLGFNGAGKSSIMKTIAGSQVPTQGGVYLDSVMVGNFPLRPDTIGYLPETPSFYDEMTVSEYLEYIGTTRGYRHKILKKLLKETQGINSLGEVWNQTIETLSKGYRQRIGLAQALIHNPRNLVLDEPTDGLDPIQKDEIHSRLKNNAKERSTLISTHSLGDIEDLCTRVIVIAKGKIIADEAIDQLSSSSANLKSQLKDLMRGESI